MGSSFSASNRSDEFETSCSCSAHNHVATALYAFSMTGGLKIGRIVQKILADRLARIKVVKLPHSGPQSMPRRRLEEVACLQLAGCSVLTFVYLFSQHDCSTYHFLTNFSTFLVPLSGLIGRWCEVATKIKVSLRKVN